MKNILDTNEFHTNKIIRRNKKYKVYIYIYGYLINYEDFNNLNENGEWRGRVLWRGYVHPHPHPHT